MPIDKNLQAHHLVRKKQETLNFLLDIIKANKQIKLKKLKKEAYTKIYLSPSLTTIYLKELEELGYIRFDKEEVYYLKEEI